MDKKIEVDKKEEEEYWGKGDDGKKWKREEEGKKRRGSLIGRAVNRERKGGSRGRL